MPDSSVFQESSASVVQPAPSPFAAFQFPDFRLYQASTLCSTIGLQMQAVAVGWQVYAITERPLDLGYVGLALFAPSLLFAAVTGHAADRIDRRKLLVACHTLLLFASGLLFAMTELSRSTVAI